MPTRKRTGIPTPPRERAKAMWMRIPENLRDEAKEDVIERAAIMQWDGGMSRDDAEIRAMEIVARRYVKFY